MNDLPNTERIYARIEELENYLEVVPDLHERHKTALKNELESLYALLQKWNYFA